MRRMLKPELLLVENIKALLHGRRIDANALALWCGHEAAWISKILSGQRGVRVRELGKVADFFGLTVAQLFEPGISPLTERRIAERRGHSRRTGTDRRRHPDRQGALHPDVRPRFPPHNRDDEEQAS